MSLATVSATTLTSIHIALVLASLTMGHFIFLSEIFFEDGQMDFGLRTVGLSLKF